jgi:hypothetical protein
MAGAAAGLPARGARSAGCADIVAKTVLAVPVAASAEALKCCCIVRAAGALACRGMAAVAAQVLLLASIDLQAIQAQPHHTGANMTNNH